MWNVVKGNMCVLYTFRIFDSFNEKYRDNHSQILSNSDEITVNFVVQMPVDSVDLYFLFFFGTASETTNSASGTAAIWLWGSHFGHLWRAPLLSSKLWLKKKPDLTGSIVEINASAKGLLTHIAGNNNLCHWLWCWKGLSHCHSIDSDIFHRSDHKLYSIQNLLPCWESHGICVGGGWRSRESLQLKR